MCLLTLDNFCIFLFIYTSFKNEQLAYITPLDVSSLYCYTGQIAEKNSSYACPMPYVYELNVMCVETVSGHVVYNEFS